MKSKRLTWSLVAACVVLIAALVAAWLVPYFRERAALAELERQGVRVLDPGFGSFGRSIGGIVLEPGRPEWLQSLLGDEWMRPFDRVRTVDFCIGPSDVDRATRVGVAPLLHRLRNIDDLWIWKSQLTEAEIEELRARFPGMTVAVVSGEGISEIPPLRTQGP